MSLSIRSLGSMALSIPFLITLGLQIRSAFRQRSKEPDNRESIIFRPELEIAFSHGWPASSLVLYTSPFNPLIVFVIWTRGKGQCIKDAQGNFHVLIILKTSKRGFERLSSFLLRKLPPFGNSRNVEMTIYLCCFCCFTVSPRRPCRPSKYRWVFRGYGRFCERLSRRAAKPARRPM
jgi:hypothetical protein